MNPHELIFFSIFIVIITGIILLDLGVFDRRDHVVPFREAMFYTLAWIVLSFGFYGLLLLHGEWIHLGNSGTLQQLEHLIDKFDHPINISGLSYAEALKVYKNNLGLEFLTGYLIEKALSVDNIFVIVMIFYAFGVDSRYYRRVLFWGILAAIVLRFLFIFTASALIQQFNWVLYFFGGLLIYTSVHMMFSRKSSEQINVATHPVVKFASKHFRVHQGFLRNHFFLRKEGKLYITPLFIVLMVIEFSDLVFAVDSIPAIFAITKDPYIVFFSNIFAILGLRAMFFMVVNVIGKFRFLKAGLALLLFFIGCKMLAHSWLKALGFTTVHSLIIIVSILFISILASVIVPEKLNKARDD
ncbi:MAG: TerC/Alx family metal homeostasis membrane protein [Lentimicrobiaceae bacterium]|nr:TerC/Alx family metal homeostasis membrane protein [Lentimicrobiaceae bacterium]